MALGEQGFGPDQTNIHANHTYEALKEVIYQSQDVSKVVFFNWDFLRFVLMTKKNAVKLIKHWWNFYFAEGIKHVIWKSEEGYR